MRCKKLVTHVASHASAVSLLENGGQCYIKSNHQYRVVLSFQVWSCKMKQSTSGVTCIFFKAVWWYCFSLWCKDENAHSLAPTAWNWPGLFPLHAFLFFKGHVCVLWIKMPVPKYSRYCSHSHQLLKNLFIRWWTTLLPRGWTPKAL